MKFIQDRIIGLIEWIYGLNLFIILALILFVAQNITYTYKRDFIWPNIAYLLGGIAVYGIVFYLDKLAFFNKLIRKKSDKLIIPATVMLFLTLVYITYNYYFYTGWDVDVLLCAAKEVAAKVSIQEGTSLSQYFSSYPNNLFLVWVFSLVIRLGIMTGISNGTGLVIIIAMQCLISSLSALLVYKICYMLKSEFAWCGWIIYVITACVSPWISIPYSDAMGVIFPVGMLYLYMSMKKGGRTSIKCFLLGVLTIIAYKIKPQLLIIAIAIFIEALLDFKCEMAVIEKARLKRLAAALAGAAITLVFVGFAIKSLPIEMNNEDRFGMSHFAMMGLNKSNNGGYIDKDVQLTKSFSSYERTSGNVNEIKKRLKEYGAYGMMEHLIKKTLVNYSDGTFAWGQEGNFYVETYKDKNSFLSPLLKSFYYEGGKFYKYFMGYSQMMWTAALFGCLMAFIFKNRGSAERIMMLAIIGLTLFELIFEARARYLYCYLPIYIILATVGMKSLYNAVWEKVQRWS